jgi:outer membrane autotransporter protein
LTGAANQLASAIYSGSGNAPLAFLDQMNADAPGAAINANLEAGREFADAIGDRLAARRDPGPPPRSANEQRGWYTGSAFRGPKETDNGGFGVWTAGFGSIAAFSADRKSGASAESGGAGGVALGVDYRIANFTAGVAAGVSEGASAAGAVTGGARAAHVGAYAGVGGDGLYAQGSASAGFFSDTTTRTVAAPAGSGLGDERESGGFKARELRGRVEVGWSDPTPGLHVQPFASVDVAAIENGSYAETVGTGGSRMLGDLGLAFARRTTLSIPAVVGLRLEGSIILAGGVVVTPTASVALDHEFATRRDFLASLNVLPGAPFALSAAGPAANALQFKAGIRAKVSRSLSLFASIEGEAAAGHHRLAGHGGLIVDW